MRRRPGRLESRLVYAAVGASILAIPATAAAFAPSNDKSSSGSPIKARLKRSRIHYGYPAVVVGRAPSSDRGQTIALQFTRMGSGDWRQIASGRVGRGGRFHLVGWLRSSGWLRTISHTPVATAAGTFSLQSPAQASTSLSRPERVAVSATIRTQQRAINDLGGQSISLGGRLVPSTGRRWIELQADPSGRWDDVASARTDRFGWFHLRYRPTAPGQDALRVRFAGDRNNGGDASSAGSVTVYQPEVASWYNDAGNTACGFHAYYGVANLSLPCGARVSFDYGGRRVQAVVDDRGPYVGGRTWDLNQNTAAALGFGGVGTVWSSR